MKKGLIIIVLSLSILFWGSLLLIAGFTIFLPAKKDLNLNYYLPIILPDADGIKHGTRVYALGVDIGYVRYIDYISIDSKGNMIDILNCEDLCKDQQSGQIILAILNIRRHIDFYENYSIHAKSYSLIGEKVIEITPGSKIEMKNQRKKLVSPINVRYLSINEFYQLIQNRYIPLNVNKLLLSKNYDDPLKTVWTVVNENRENLKRIFYNTRMATEKINRGEGTISLLLNENNIHENLDGVLAEAIILINFLDELAESLREHNIVSKTLGGTTNLINPQPTNR